MMLDPPLVLSKLEESDTIDISSSYVYNVRAGDYQGFIAALRGAFTDPMPERYIDPEMTEDAMRHRISSLVGRDWETQAKKRWEELEAEGQVPVCAGVSAQASF